MGACSIQYVIAHKACPGRELYAVTEYTRVFTRLPEPVREAIIARWGAAEDDPFVEGQAFRLAAFRLGKVVIGLQPARGYNSDPVASYHDPGLVPTHG